MLLEYNNLKKKLMGHLFYLFGLIVLFFNIFNISKYKRIFELREWMIKFKKVTGRNPVVTEYRKNDDKDILTTWSVSVIFTSFWIFLGLLTKNWYVFLFIILLNTFINLITRVVGEFSIFSFIMQFVKNILILFVVIFLILNHFHLHLDIWNSIKSFL
jgi:hypothetical protein